MENSVKNLMFDLALNREIVDEEQGRVVSTKEANEVLRQQCFEILGINEKSTDKQIRRAMKSDKANEWFEVLEEIIDTQIKYGITNNEFFNQFVETKTKADGDRTDFWVDDEVLLNVVKVSGDNHYHTIQRLGSGAPFQVSTAKYGIKVGGDIREFLLGRKDWSKFVAAVADAFMRKIQTETYAEFVGGTSKIAPPSVLVGTGALTTATKATLDGIIEKVEAANESSVVIMGTKTALKNLNALTIVDWADPADSIKEAVATTGIIGNYEGTPLVQLPQKFYDKTLLQPVIANNVLLIMPLVDNKPVKFVDGGETEFLRDQIGDTMDNMQSLEVEHEFGVATVMTRYYGKWTI